MSPTARWLLPGAAFGILLWLEARRPLRRPTREKIPRLLHNAAIAAGGATVAALVEAPITARLAGLRLGIVPRLRLPRAAERALALALMDYTLYLWHVLTHKVPALWRVHAVHHADPDLDVTTGLRFHFAEMLASVPWRAAQVVLIGVSRDTLELWQALTAASVLFHHSNVRVPAGVELILVSPRMHGIHHSDRPEHADSNWSSGLSIWDRLHGTMRRDVAQDRIRIGLPQGPPLEALAPP